MSTERVVAETNDDAVVVRVGTSSGDARLTGGDLLELSALVRDAGNRHILLLPGGPDFCLGRADDSSEAIGLSTRERVLIPISSVYEAITSHPGTVIAAVRGRCFGLGFAIACAADLVIACPDAQFALPEARAGFAPLLALSQVAARLPSPLVRRMALTCESVGVDQLSATGLITAMTEPDELEQAGRALLATMPESRITRDVKGFFSNAQFLPVRDRVAYAVDGLERALSGD